MICQRSPVKCDTNYGFVSGELTNDPDIRKGIEEKVAEYEASEEKYYVDWHPDNTPEENSVTLPDGNRIEVVNPMEIRVVPAESEDEGSST